MQLQEYNTVKQTRSAEFTIKKSRFIAHVSPVETEGDALNFVDQIKTEHKDATHNVFAFRVGLENDLKRQNDDGEPSGTAGKPVLDVIERQDIRNVVIVVTRYFGGIKLGAGGLVRAYSNSARQGVAEAGIALRTLHQLVEVSVDYTFLGKIQNEINQSDWVLYDIEYSDKVTLKVALLPAEIDKFINFIEDVSSGQSDVTVGDTFYLAQ